MCQEQLQRQPGYVQTNVRFGGEGEGFGGGWGFRLAEKQWKNIGGKDSLVDGRPNPAIQLRVDMVRNPHVAPAEGPDRGGLRGGGLELPQRVAHGQLGASCVGCCWGRRVVVKKVNPGESRGEPVRGFSVCSNPAGISANRKEAVSFGMAVSGKRCSFRWDPRSELTQPRVLSKLLKASSSLQCRPRW